MKAGRQELIDAELRRAEESHQMAQLALDAHLWNSAAGELYYTCFHLVQALFVKVNDTSQVFNATNADLPSILRHTG